MSDAAPLVSICIANYNGMEFIDECIASVLTQVGDIAVDIIVHDDASTDGSVQHLCTQWPQVQLIVSEANVGFCVANNRMVAQARGEFVLLLNNDAALWPDALQSLLTAARGEPQVGIWSLPQYDAASGALVDRGCLLDPFYNPVPNLDAKRQDVAMVIGACLWTSKSLWDELDGFLAWFESIAEDMYLCCRARLVGRAVRVLPVSGYRHRQGASFGGNKSQDGKLSTTFRRRALSERNKTFVMVMTCPSPFVQMLLPLHLLVLLVEGTLLSLLKLDVGYLTGIYLPVFVALLQRRQEIRTERGDMNARKVAFFSVFDWTPYKLRMLMRHGLPEIR